MPSIPMVAESDAECHSVTDSVGSHSDYSANTHVTMTKPHMEVVCVIDICQNENVAQRKKALEDVKMACIQVGASLSHIQFEKLDFGEANVVSSFYNADVVIIDISLPTQQTTLIYHLGVRESFNMKQNILIYNDCDPEVTLRLTLSCSNYPFISYKLSDLSCITTCPNRTDRGEEMKNDEFLYQKLKKLLKDVEVQSKTYMKERFLADLKKINELKSGTERKEALKKIKKRLDDPNVLSGETIVDLLLSFRDIQAYDSMIHLVEGLNTVPAAKKYINSYIIFLYCFALNRRKKEGDREKALQECIKALKEKENHFPDMLCLCGRIYKDKFTESNYTDKDSLNQAILWYKKGFDCQSNEYAGINLATLLVIKGEEFSKSSELQHIAIVLNSLIGKKGSLASLIDYWDVATFFEISVLAQNYANAIQAAEHMFRLKPPDWYLKSTIGNIQLIDRFRKKKEDDDFSAEEKIFFFWMDFFKEATKTAQEVPADGRFPVLIFEPSKEYMPSHIWINLGAEPQTLQVTNECLKRLKGQCTEIHDWEFTADDIRHFSLNTQDDRSSFLYVLAISDCFQLFFPSEACRSVFHGLLTNLLNYQERPLDLDSPVQEIRCEYERDEQGKKKILGKGTYGVVYAAIDLNKQVRIAVKEVPEKNLGTVQPLHEEIRLHSQLRHKNIVQYLGSLSEDGFFKIFMEQVPGGSLSALLRSKWGSLQKNENTMSSYTKNILEGLKYLHSHRIVHRDIKGDNVLVNTYSGVAKISDFGTSKRLIGLSPSTQTFAGTIQYMAPEVIDRGQRGYAAPADVWSLGCTVVEMATGKPPFIELGSAQAALFKVGFHKAHPEIPELSEKATAFILKCFETNPDKRPTAEELLEDPFISNEKKKTVRGTTEFSRSVSVPVDKLASKTHSGHSSAPNQTPELESSTYTHTRASSLLPPIQMPTDLCFGSLASTPSLDCGDSILDHGERRNSSGTLLSPEAELGSDDFYHLKKDSQRRTTLAKVLANDGNKICELWMQKVRESSVGATILTPQHLLKLMDGLKAYLTEPLMSIVEKTVKELKEELDYDSAAIHQLQLAIYLYQESVNEVLRLHPIKPHWMFALDNLVRSCVQAAITVLSPELGENLATQGSVDTTKSNKTNESFELGDAPIMHLKPEHTQLCHDCMEQVKKVVAKELVDINKQQLEPLKSVLQEVVRQLQDVLRVGAKTDIQEEIEEDPRLANWLKGLGISDLSQRKVLSQGYKLEELLHDFTREEVRRLGLLGAYELRIWKAIKQYRATNGLPS
ncbi:mitogen-activated protein kinase kinase kinase 15 isoform X2 [Anthonomus grandis grandis]|uniref:mitogen-activated protein kinase kinase kinase 15 isoform X2 n=1 Tax=Anthonomus grandis grandis TaxID=2921223 RepID=UPI0021665530|nr:mitogen-activated protein kinase kinase kinase 15 isoform X2 [Anthonomus grandis grandis]